MQQELTHMGWGVFFVVSNAVAGGTTGDPTGGKPSVYILIYINPGMLILRPG
jgi:hypothetical protein